MKNHFKESIVCKNKTGKIVCLENMMFGSKRYVLFDLNGNYVKDIPVPFKVSDYL